MKAHLPPRANIMEIAEDLNTCFPGFSPLHIPPTRRSSLRLVGDEMHRSAGRAAAPPRPWRRKTERSGRSLHGAAMAGSEPWPWIFHHSVLVVGNLGPPDLRG